jgi:hypothetical protein
MKRTLFDLYTSAHKAALNSLNAANSFVVENTALEAFNADSNDPLDWDYWKQQFDNRRTNMLALKQQPAPSARVTPATAGQPAPKSGAQSIALPAVVAPSTINQ